MATATTSELRCLICDAHNAQTALLCKSCSAPVALGREAAAQGRDPNLVSIIGDSNVGKTVYLGFLLDMLSQNANNFEAVPIGSHSVDLPQLVISHMAYRMFPPKTPMETDEWNWAYYQVCKRGRSPRWIDLIMPDIAGEALSAEIASPSTFKAIQSLLSKTAGMLLLTDAAMAANGSSQPDFFGIKMLSYIDSMYATKRRRKIETPIAVVLTKSDYCCEAFDEPARFVRTNLSRLWSLCESRFANVRFFASSVIGSLAYAPNPQEQTVTPIPLHTALRGVLEPFEWIVDQL